MTKPTAVRVAATGARLIAGIAVSAACVAGAVVAIPAAWPAVVHEPAQTSVVPAPGDTLLTCGGPFLALGRDAQNAGQLSTAGTPTVTAGAIPGSTLAEAPLAILGVSDASAGTMYSAAPKDRDPAQVAAAESVTIGSADVAGFAAGACRPPSMESWIVGGAASTGATDVLVVANPGAVTATVSFTVFGSQGEKRTSALIVPPRSQSSIPLAAGAAGEASPVVQVTATGAPVRTVLQSSLIRTLDPAGIDLQDGIAAPSTSFSLVGVRVVVPPGAAGVTTSVRLLAPTADATVRLQPRAAETGAPVGEAKTVSLKAGQPGEVDMSSLKPGTYAIDVEASAPVVAGAWQATGLGKGSDFSWMTPAPDLIGPTAFAVADGPSPQLQIVNAGAADAQATITPASGGQPQTVSIPAGGSAVVNVAPARVYELDVTGTVRAALSYSAAGKLAGYPLWPVTAASPEITVYQ